jgi:hypothetical protein
MATIDATTQRAWSLPARAAYGLGSAGALRSAQQQQQRRAYGTRPTAATSMPRHATTVFDLVSLPASGGVGAGIVQAMPPRVYDLHIDGAPYSVIALEGLGEAPYLRALLDERALAEAETGIQQPPVAVDLTCAGGGRPTAAVRDAAFLLMAYGITSTAALDADEQLCLFDVALAYGLPLSFADWLGVLASPSAVDGLPGKARDIAALCRIVDAVGINLPSALALAPGAAPQAVAAALGRVALGALLRTPGGDVPRNTTAVVLTLATARGPSDLDAASSAAWNRALVRGFGEAYAADRALTNPLGALPVGLSGDYLALAAEPAIASGLGAAPYDRADPGDDADSGGYYGPPDDDGSQFGRMDGFVAPTEGVRGCGSPSSAVPDSDAALVAERVARFYEDKASALAERVRESLGALVGRWLATPAGAGADIIVHYASATNVLGDRGAASVVAAGIDPLASTLVPRPVQAAGSVAASRRVVFADVRYDPALTAARAASGDAAGDAFYTYAPEAPPPSAAAALTGPVITTTTAVQRREAALRTILAGPWTRIDVRLTPANLAAAGLTAGDCARPDVVLAAIGWPLPAGVSPYDPATCTVSADVGTAVASLGHDRMLRASLASATTP